MSSRSRFLSVLAVGALLVAALLVMRSCDGPTGDPFSQPPPGESEADPAGDADAPAGSAATDAPTPAPRVEADGMTVEDLVVPQPVTGERTAMYFTVRSDGADTLVAVEADGVEAASLHRSAMEEGVMRMRPVDGGLPIPAGGEARLRPGGLHVMLEGIGGAWTAGDTVRLRLIFRNAGAVEVPALVVPYAELDTRFPREGTDEMPEGGEAAGG